jgi:hypothetical protein
VRMCMCVYVCMCVCVCMCMCVYGCVFTTIVITYLFIYLFIYLSGDLYSLPSLSLYICLMHAVVFINTTIRHKIHLHCYDINHQMTIFLSGKVYGYMFRLVLDIRKPIQNIQVSFITSVGNAFYCGVRHLFKCLFTVMNH